jgi:hypothetical protein
MKIKVARSFKEIGFNTLYVLIRTTVVGSSAIYTKLNQASEDEWSVATEVE